MKWWPLLALVAIGGCGELAIDADTRRDALTNFNEREAYSPQLLLTERHTDAGSLDSALRFQRAMAAYGAIELVVASACESSQPA